MQSFGAWRSKAALSLAGWAIVTLAGFGMAAAATPDETYHPGRVLVSYHSNAHRMEIDRLHARHGAWVVKRLDQGRLEVVSLPASLSVPEAVRKYASSGHVRFAEPDYLRHLALAPNDPKYADGTLWGLNNLGQNGGLVDADIDGPEAWEFIASATNVVVAILDTGIRPTHEDLAANIWTNPVAGGYGWNALSNSVTPLDDEGHGSLMAGVMGAVGNNGKGIVGVAWRARLMACKCMNNQKVGLDSDIIEAIEFARTNGAKILNASLGGTNYSQALSNAIYSARQDGIIMVAACGNNGRDIDNAPYYPASYPMDNIVSAAFTDRNDRLGTLSNFGATNVDLAAPGAAMHSTFWVSDTSYLGAPSLAGTSFAAAQVSGALALAINRFPGEPYTKTIQRVLAAVDLLPSLANRCCTGGRLNLHNIVNPPITLSVTLAGTDRIIAGRTSPERACVIEASEDLKAWSAIGARVSSETGSFELIDSAPEATRKFYRAVAGQ